MNDIFYISKLLIKKKLNVLTASDELKLKKFNKEYPFSKDVKIERLIDKIDDYSNISKEKAWESIQEKSQNRIEKPVVILNRKTWYNYAAAAVIIGILTGTYFFKDNIFNSPEEPTPIIVNTNAIMPGTDKATLTLGDGSLITLEKGKSLQTQNVKSNGEEIIYESGKRNTKEIAYNYLTIPRGGQFHVVLSDGTEVWLNSESQLKYPVAFIEGEIRQVELVYGEAYFEVSPSKAHKGAKFKVSNKSQEVEVIGTEFNIKAYKDENNIYTTLVDGKVNVNIENTTQKLTPNQQLNLDTKTNISTIKDVDVFNEIAWKDGVFSFEEKSLKEIMIVLSRWYNINVIYENNIADDNEHEFVGIFRKNKTIKEILSNIKKSGIINDYKINNDEVTLK